MSEMTRGQPLCSAAGNPAVERFEGYVHLGARSNTHIAVTAALPACRDFFVRGWRNW